MKRYFGPYKAKDETTIVIPSYPCDDTYTVSNASGLVSMTTIPQVCPATVDTFHSLYTPGFDKLKREGYIIQCPYSKTSTGTTFQAAVITDETWVGSAKTYGRGVNSRHVTRFANPGIFPQLDADLQTAISRAKSEVLTKVFSKAVSPNVDLLVDLSQLGETLRMFLTLARRLLVLASSPGAFFRWVWTNSVGKSRTARIPGNPHGRLDELAGLWVELRFGWRPLLISIDEFAKSLAEGDDEAPNRITYRSLEELKYEKEAVASTTSSLLGFSIANRFTTTVRVEGTVRGGILLERQSSMLQKMGFEWHNVPYAAWDLVPWSFIVDRFINIGHWLRALRPIHGTAFGGAWVVTRLSHTTTYKGDYPSAYFTSGSGSSFKSWKRTSMVNVVEEKALSVVREIHEHAPIFPTPKWDWASITDLYNSIDGIMLAIQQVSKSADRMNGRGK